jgi:hypothetical protein
MALLAALVLLGLPLPAATETTRTVDAVYEHEFCEEPIHRDSRFCRDGGMSPDDPRREAFRWYVLQQRCRLTDRPAYCKDIDAVQPGQPVMVLTYDHSAARWDLDGTKTETRSSLDANGRPTVYAASQDSLLVVITNSNPLIYGSSVGEVKEEEIAQLAALQSLMTGLGTAIQGWLTMTGQRLTEAPSPSARTLTGIEQSVADAIDAVAAERERRVLLLSDESLATKHAIDRVSRCREAMVAVVQQLEVGYPTAYSCRPLQQAVPSPPRSVTAALNERYDDAVWFGADMKPAIVRFLALLQLPSPTSAAVANRVADVRQALAGMPSQNASSVLGALVGEIQAALDRLARATDIDAALGLEARRFANLDRALELDPAELKLVTAVDGVLAKAADINLAAAVLAAAERRYADNLLGGLPRMWFEVTPPSNDVSWDVIRTYPVSVVADAPYAKQVALAHPAKSASSYALASTSSRLFGVDIGVTATNVVDREFSAVADPANPKQKVIGQTGETNRSGQFGVFLDYWIVQRWHEAAEGWSVRPGLQIGAALSGDNPAVHAGGVFEVARYARFGAGVTFQRVTRLDGQQVGDSIDSRDDISTRDRFERGWYVSFAFALDSLSLFGGH